MLTATIYRQDCPITGPLIVYLSTGETFEVADKPAALAEAKRRGAVVIPNA